MNKTIEAILNRYSCRAFADKPLTDEQVKTLGRCAMQSPSAMNRQPWFVSVVTNVELLDELETAAAETLRGNEEMYNRIMSRGGKVFYNAPCAVCIALANDSGDYAKIDLGILAQNVVIAATAMGLNTVHVGMMRLAFDGDMRDHFDKQLRLPEGYSCGYAVLVGHAATDGSVRQPEMGKLVYID